MSNDTFRFQLGAFDCMVVNDGNSPYSDPVTIFFANAPREQLKKALENHNLDISKWKEYVSSYPSVLIDTGQHRVLVDTGGGSLEPTTGKLILNLRAEGIIPEDIDTVILTHAHPDHIGGNIDNKGKPTFPNARYILSKDEWTFWSQKPSLNALDISESDKELIIKCARDYLLPLQNQVELVKRGEQIVPGVFGVAAPGHTPGHMAVSIISGSKQLLCVGDALIHPIHVERPEWYLKYDLVPGQIVETRRQLLARAATGKVMVHAFHFPFPGLGYVVQKGDGWQWQTMSTRPK